MDPQLVISFIGASVLLTLMPGPDIVYVILESISKSTKVGLTIAFGLVSGLVIHTLLAATGISILIQQSDLAYSILKILGALYLFQLAYKTIYEKKPLLDNATKSVTTNYQFLPLWKKGFLMNVLNPKVSLFFIALFPQFLTPDGIAVPYQMIILGLIFFIQSVIIFTIVCFLAGKLSLYFQTERFWKIAKWSKFSVLLILAIGIMLSRN